MNLADPASVLVVSRRGENTTIKIKQPPGTKDKGTKDKGAKDRGAKDRGRRRTEDGRREHGSEVQCSCKNSVKHCLASPSFSVLHVRLRH